MIRIFIGKDDIENVAYHVLCESIIRQSSQPVSITPIYLKNFSKFFNRDRDEKQSNEFSFSRFLVPYLCGYSGHAIFMDCDMLVRTDIYKLWEQRSFLDSLQVVKHDYTPVDETKFLGNKQYKYEKKNWSSMVIWNCGHFHTKRLTPEYIEKASGLDLHQLKWTDESRTGSLKPEWNHLVGEYPHDPDAKIVHFTRGGPWFHEYKNCDYAGEWLDEFSRMAHVS